MNTQRIEGKGITSVNDFIFNSSILVPHLDFNDKTDSWDGFIFAYSNETNKKSNLLGRIPVQVKSSEVRAFSGRTKTKAFYVSDLINYKNDGGVIIFSVEHCGKSKRIFFSALLPYDLNRLLKGSKVEQKTINIVLRQIPVGNILEFENVCREFLMHRKKQFSLPMVDFPQDRIKEFMIQGVVSGDMAFDEMLLSRNHYLYGKTDIDSALYDCVTKINIEEIKKTLNRTVSVGNKAYYSNYNVISTKRNTQLLFGNNVMFTIEKGMLDINYAYAGTLDERIHDTEFIKKFISTKEIKIDGISYPLITGNVNKRAMQKFNNYNECLMNIAALLNIFKISHQAIDLDSISNDDGKRLGVLVNSMVYNNPAPEQKQMPGIYRFKVGNLSFLTVINKNPNSKVEIYDFNTFSQGKIRLFPNDADYKDDLQAGHDVSIYILLTADDILCSNIKLNEVISHVTRYKHLFEHDSRVLLLTLEMIKVYDKTKSIEYLDCANELLSWLKEGPIDESIIVINELQINKRKRQLTRNEEKYLYKLKEIEKKNDAILCGVSILLEDTEIFHHHFEKLSETEKNQFKSYPIYSLVKQ